MSKWVKKEIKIWEFQALMFEMYKFKMLKMKKLIMWLRWFGLKKKINSRTESFVIDLILLSYKEIRFVLYFYFFRI